MTDGTKKDRASREHADQAKSLLRHYFRQTLKNYDSDSSAELGEIVDHIVDAAVARVASEARANEEATHPTWLIEHPEGWHWWREHPSAGYGWRGDANEATRYATRDECEAAIVRVRHAGPTWIGHASEHAFRAAPLQTRWMSRLSGKTP